MCGSIHRIFFLVIFSVPNILDQVINKPEIVFVFNAIAHISQRFKKQKCIRAFFYKWQVHTKPKVYAYLPMIAHLV